uniref:RNA transcription, translation and transport factor protein n=1 Tax=Cyprinus carpio TaxID=7962 RepID=A0A8C2E338_CYPCA
MFRRKLTALEYHNPTGFDCKDDTEFRNIIVWLEDQKIRHYKIEERGNLRNIPSSDWPKHYEKVRQIYLYICLILKNYIMVSTKILNIIDHNKKLK